MVLLSSLSFCPEAVAGGGTVCAPQEGQRGWKALMHSELQSSRLTSMIKVFSVIQQPLSLNCLSRSQKV